MRFKMGLMAMLALCVAFAGCKNKAQVEAETAAKKVEQDKLQGKWKVVSREGDEEEGEEPAAASSYYVIEGDIFKFVYKGTDGKEEEYSRKKLSFPADKDPKQLDMTYVDESGKPLKEAKVKKGFTGKKKVTTTEMKDVAIYKIDGDKLTMAISFDDKKRPTGFTGTKGSSSYVLTLEKIKDGKEPAETPATKVVDDTPATKKADTPATKKVDDTPATKKADTPATKKADTPATK